MPSKPKAKRPTNPPGFPSHPIYDTLAAEGFDPLMDLGAPFDLDAVIQASYHQHAPSHLPPVPERLRP